ncbi:hypothetical protein CSUI_001911, partial [Cystoisospora suis]
CVHIYIKQKKKEKKGKKKLVEPQRIEAYHCVSL